LKHWRDKADVLVGPPVNRECEEHVVKERLLGGTEISVSEIGIGAWQLSGPLLMDGAASGHPDLGKGYTIDLIRQCGEMGINLIDVAEHFGAGEGERRVGEAVKGNRDRWVLCSKFGIQVCDVELDPHGVPSGRRAKDLSADRMQQSLEASLRRLQTDYIDIYLCQAAPSAPEAEALADALHRAKRNGQVRAVGLNTSDFRQVEIIRSLGLLDVVEFPRSLLQPQDAILGLVRETGCGALIRGSMADGRLSGKYFHRTPTFFPEDARSPVYEQIHAAELFQACAVFEAMVSDEHTMVQLALRYLLDEPATHAILLGAKSEKDYAQAARATELPPLTDAERSQLEACRAPLMAGREHEPELANILEQSSVQSVCTFLSAG
jgi:aryl-alcohol dehydrogenase-like predicted oxidoreductase